MPIQVNITTKVNSKTIRREDVNGRPHWIVPSFTLPSNVVMNNIMYPRSEVERTYKSLDGTLAPLGHPTVNGEFISAFSAEGINIGHVGAYNRNVKLSGNRVSIEKYIDIEVAERTEGGKRLLERLEELEAGKDVPPIHTSVAAFIDELAAPEGSEYKSIAQIHTFDHDAILLDVPGAATPEQGVGMMVNADQAIALKSNSGALIGESFRDREQRIDRAAKAQFVTADGDYAYVVDFTNSQAIIVTRSDTPTMYGYTEEAGKITFDVSTATPVARQESWVAMAVNRVKDFFQPQARPAKNKEGDMPITEQEQAALTKDISQAVIKDVGEVIANALKPFATQLETLQANQKVITDSLTANEKAEEVEKRKVVTEKHGEVVANSLSGEALDTLYKSCGKAAPIGNSAAANGTLEANKAPNPTEYFSEEVK